MNLDFLNALLPTIDSFHSIGYWIAFFAAFLETLVGIGMFLPGSVILIFMGAFSHQGYLDVGDLLWFAFFGAVLGDNINYYLGHKYGIYFLKSGVWFIKSHHLQKGREFLNSYGAKSIFFGRFIPGIKEIAPLIAGSLHMKWRVFLKWNILGAVGWALLFVLSGYVFSKSIGLAEVWVSKFAILLFILFVTYLFYIIIKILQKEKQ